MLTGIPVRPSATPRQLSLAIVLALACPFTAVANDYLDQLTPAQRAEFDGNWGLAVINAQYAYARGLTGAGQVLGVADTGVAPSHPELAGRVIGVTAAGLRPDGSRCDSGAILAGPAACFYTKGDQPSVSYIDWNSSLLAKTIPGIDESVLRRYVSSSRYNTHGTHVAGIMAAARDGQGMHGVAPAARVASVSLLSNVYSSMEKFLQLPGGISLQLAPTREFFEQAYAGLASNGVRVLNNSWTYGSKPPRSVADVDAMAKQFASTLDPIAAASLRTGLLQVWGAGNFAGATADLPAALPRYRPEVEPYWLSVVSVAANGTLDRFSSRCGLSREWCVGAPGDQIKSAVINGQAAARPVRDASGAVIGLEVAGQQTMTFSTSPFSGTSAAAPQVSGALGLLIERFPYLTNPQIRDVLLTTATDLGAPGVDDIFGWGLINLRKAIDGPGLLRVDTTVVMDQPGGGKRVWSGEAWDEWRNDIGGPGRLTKAGPGWLRLAGANTFGGANVDGGTLELSGDNQLSGAVAVSKDGQLRVAGRLAGSDVSMTGGQTWIGGSYEGNASLSNGARWQLAGQQRGALRLSASQADISGTFDGELDARAGSLLWLREPGRINAGVLRLADARAVVDGRIAANVEAGPGSRIEGNGQLGPTRMAGTIAPGNSIGTLTVAGDYVQLPGSAYEAELGPAGTSDLLQVAGRARLQGGALRPALLGANAMLGQSYRVLTAGNGVEGRFTTVDGSLPTPFLSFAARYGANAIDVAIARGVPLASAATTRNQRSIAAAVDATPDANLLPQRLTRLTPAQLPAALDPLGGELYASARTLLLQDTQLLRDAALARARNGQDPFTAQALADGSRGLWADVRQSERRADSDGNASAARLSGSSLLMGYDHRLDGGWQFGVLGGGGRNNLLVREGQDRAIVRARHAGLHLGRRWGGLGLRMGAGYSWQDLRSQRRAAIAGQVDPRARYDANSAQWFAELGYRFEGSRGGVEPFVQYAGLRLRSDGAQETGGVGALAIASARQTVGLWSGGLRFNLDLAAREQPQRWLSLRGSVAYQQTEGELTPAARVQWQDGPSFNVWGVPLARHSTVSTLGIAARLSRNSLLTFDWRGAFATQVRDTGFGARYSLRF